MLAIDKISIIGNGNVGSHLIRAFRQSGVQVTHAWDQSVDTDIIEETEWVSSPDQLPIDQIVILCLPDDVTPIVVNQIKATHAVAYTSGSVDLEQFDRNANVGVFYPLQTFSKAIELDYKKIPFFIEATNDEFASLLIKLAEKISTNVHLADSDYRTRMHKVAVWVNNFTNHILFQAQELARSEEISFEHMKPLLEETVRKLNFKGAYEAQTGPARREDTSTIEKHLKTLSPEQRDLYLTLTNSILQTYGHEKL